MKKLIVLLFSLFIVLNVAAQGFSKYVNPFIGTDGHGHTFPGAIVPFGMVQLSPDTRIDGSWDGCSGYHYSDSTIYGFSHTHLNGVGVSDYGDIMLMPMMGKPSLDNKIYSSKFSHEHEKATAGYYYVKLLDDNIDVNLTATKRVGYHQYTFNKTGQANIILDLNHRDELLEGEVNVIDNKTIQVFRRSNAWAENQYCYARIEFSKPLNITKYIADEKDGTLKNFKGKTLKIALSSNVKKGETISVKVALSLTGYDGADKNMNAEGKTWDFAKIRQDAVKLWDKELSKIEIGSTDKDKLSTFYTSLYHMFTQPNIANDVDGKYRGRDNKIHVANHDYYTVFSLWDTFRAYHPLMTLIDKKRTVDFINTFLLQFEQGKRLPIWELASNETFCMIGYHSVSVIADAMAAGIKGFDYEKAFQASKASANNFNDFGMKAYRDNGFISIDDEHESVSKTVEYAYNDWCIAQMAKMLGHEEDYHVFMKRSQSWKNLFDYESKFIRPKKNGAWFEPFDPKEVNNHFTEGNAWHYTFFVPQDIPGMIKAYGGNEAFEKKLDLMFNEVSKTTGKEQVDVTGLIGQYAQGNEPSHHVAFLYNFVGKPEKANEKVHFILENFYKNTPDGLIGNEDCGQMSAWYVLSSMGLYKVSPGASVWTTVEPFYKNVKIHLEDGKTLEFNSRADVENFAKSQYSSSLSNFKAVKDIVIVPTITAKHRIFETSEEVVLKTPENKKIFFSVNGSPYKEYTQPFTITETSSIAAYAQDQDEKSGMAYAKIYKKPNNYKITLKSKPSPLYYAGGDNGLIDGINGDVNWRKGDWHGYSKDDFEATIDMLNAKEVSKISANFLQDTRAWVVFPTKVEFYISDDNINFKKVAEKINTIDAKDYNVQTQMIKADFPKVKGRYVKVVARNFGKLPEWHQGYPFDGHAHIFIDEITVE